MRYPSQCIIPEYVVTDVEWRPPFGTKGLQGVGTMKTLSLLLFLFLSAPALSAQAPEGIWQGYDGEWRHISQQLIALAEATPAEKYSWRPASGVRSTSEVYMHIAIANFYLLSVTGPKVPADLNENMEKTVTSKAEVIAWLKRSLEAVKTAHAVISLKDLFYWPLGEVTLCENGKYAAVVLQDEIIPCKVEANT